MKRLISVVVPVFRSGTMLVPLCRRLSAVLDGVAIDWEIILVDDASNDGTYELMYQLHEEDPRIKVVRFARNLGQHHATLYGLRCSRGDYVLTLDDDLQNPPEEIPRFIARLDEGFDLVIGKIDGSKQHSGSRNLASRIVQSLVGRILGKPRSLSLSSYRGMTRRVAVSMACYTGAHVYLPALILGSVPADRICNITVEHHSRLEGRSQYTLRKLVRLASYLLINHSSLPLRFVTIWGFLLSVASLAYAVYVVTEVAFFGGSAVKGWPALTVIVSFLSGNILMCMGILGEYIGRIVSENARAGQSPVFEERL